MPSSNQDYILKVTSATLNKKQRERGTGTHVQTPAHVYTAALPAILNESQKD